MQSARFLAVLSLLPAVMARGQQCAPPPLVPDPLRFSSLPLDVAPACPLAEGSWQLATTTSYFNLWQRSWHTARVHLGLGRAGKPLSPAELRIIERDFPRDQAYHIDVEGWRADIALAHGLGAGLVATIDVPMIGIGAPSWDAIAEGFHRLLGLNQVRRDLFPRGQTTYWIRGHRGTIEAWSELRGVDLGDIALSLAGPASGWVGGQQRWVVSLEAPTGKRGTLRGSGGWDAGLRWFSTWERGRSRTRIALGYTFLDRSGSFLGVRRANTWQALIEGSTPIGRTVRLRGAAHWDASPLRNFTGSDVARASFYWTIGLVVPIAPQMTWAVDLGENYPSPAEVPDFSVHLQVVYRF